MATFDRDNQRFYRPLNGIKAEIGNLEFATTSLTDEIGTSIISQKINSLLVLPKTEPGDYGEQLYCDGTITDQGVTLTRKGIPFILSCSPEDSAHITSFDWVLVPIGIAPVAGTIIGLKVYAKTKSSTGTPIINLGKISPTVNLVEVAGSTDGFVVGEEVAQATSLARGVVVSYTHNSGAGDLTVRTIEGEWTAAAVTGAVGIITPDSATTINASDPNFFITDTNAWGMPETLGTLVINEDDITVGASANEWASITVAAGDLITFTTTGGTGADPSGLMVQVEIRPTVSSGMSYYYHALGF